MRMRSLSGVSEEEQVPSKENLKGIEVILPSRGADYDFCPGGKILIRPMGLSECKFVAQMTSANFDSQLNIILPYVILRPKSFNPEFLTGGDRSFLFLWLRIQVASRYATNIACSNPKCKHVATSYNLEDIQIEELTEKYKSPFELTLPKSGKKVVLRLKTARDEAEIMEHIAAGCDEWLSTYAVPIISLDGVPMGFVEKYALLDHQDFDPVDFGWIREFFNWTFHGPDYSACPFKCPKCGEEHKFIFPFRGEFYLPSMEFGASFRDAVDSMYVSKRGAGNVSGAGESGDGRVSDVETEG